MPYAEVNGANIYYELTGSGVPLVCISGTGFHSDIWNLYQVPLFSQSYRVLISDHRGVGRSDKPEEFYTTRGFASDIAALMARLNLGPAHVMGHSMGGRVAQWLALDHPERVRSLILVSSGSGNFSGSPEYIRGIGLAPAMLMLEQGFDGYFQDHVESEFFFTPHFARREPERYRQVIELLMGNRPPVKCYLRHVIARQMHETTDRLHEIRVPTLVTVGDEDTMNNHFRGAQALAEGIAGAELVIIKGARHCYLWERPAEINQIILDFVQRH